MITDYSSLQSAIADYIGRSDLTTPIPMFIAQAEGRIYRGLRVAAMEKALSLTVASNAAAVPDDFVDLHDMRNSDGVPMERVTPFWLKQPGRTTVMYYFAREGANFLFSGASGTVSGSYYARLPSLSDSNTSNWLTNTNPDLILAGALIEASAYVADEAGVTYWTSRFESAMAEIQHADDISGQSGSTPVMRVG